MNQINKLGIFLSMPVAILFVMIYLSQSVLIIYLIQEKFEQEKQINFQRQQIRELEEKVKIMQVIEDFQIGFNESQKKQLATVVFDECNKYNYDPLFLLALIYTESTFKKGQVSRVGAQGLMQIRPFVGKSLAHKVGIDFEENETLFEPDKNIQLGSLHLFEMILKFKDVRKAVMSYNVGETALRARIRNDKPLPKNYFNKVMQNYNMLKEKYSA